MENENMINEETFGTVVDKETADSLSSEKFLKIAISAGLVLVVGRVIYTKLIKPAIANHKAKKAEKLAAKIETEAEELPVEVENSEEN